MNAGGIILCGGRSSRMGQPKARLPFGGELLLPRVVRIVRDVVEPVVIVAAPGQDLPPLPADVRIVCDEVEGRGPLAGLASGLTALEGRVDAVYLSSCDVPLLKPDFVRRVVAALRPTPQPPPCRDGEKESSDSGCVNPSCNLIPNFFAPPPPQGGGWGVGSSACVPRVNDQLHPLAAAYRMNVLPHVREMLAADRLKLIDLFNAVPTLLLEADQFADIDPRLLSLWNVNTPADYEAALHELETR